MTLSQSKVMHINISHQSFIRFETGSNPNWFIEYDGKWIKNMVKCIPTAYQEGWLSIQNGQCKCYPYATIRSHDNLPQTLNKKNCTKINVTVIICMPRHYLIHVDVYDSNISE